MDGRASPANTEAELGLDVPVSTVQEVPVPQEDELLPVDFPEAVQSTTPPAGQRDSPEAVAVKAEDDGMPPVASLNAEEEGSTLQGKAIEEAPAAPLLEGIPDTAAADESHIAVDKQGVPAPAHELEGNSRPPEQAVANLPDSVQPIAATAETPTATAGVLRSEEAMPELSSAEEMGLALQDPSAAQAGGTETAAAAGAAGEVVPPVDSQASADQENIPLLQGAPLAVALC